MSSLKAVIFDLDGTLLDSFALHYSAYEVMFDHFGIKMQRELFLSSYSPNWYRTYEAFGLDKQHWDAANRLWLESADIHTPELFPGVPEMLERLTRSHQLGIVTSGSKSRVTRELARLDIARHFGSVVTGDDIQNPKPAPEGLELALKEIGVASHEAIYVGDALADFEMARAADVNFLGVMSDFANLTHDHPEYRVHSIEALVEAIESLQ